MIYESFVTSQSVKRYAPIDRKTMRKIKTTMAVVIPFPIPMSSSLKIIIYYDIRYYNIDFIRVILMCV